MNDRVNLLKNEAGGHRIQRVPPTENKGRIHTSNITVAIIDCNNIKKAVFKDSDFRIEWFSGTGNGGQHRNRHKNSCRLIHKSTGLMESRQGRIRESK